MKTLALILVAVQALHAGPCCRGPEGKAVQCKTCEWCAYCGKKGRHGARPANSATCAACEAKAKR